MAMSEKDMHTGSDGKNESKQLVCIRCPIGCRMTVMYNEDNTLNITGNTCNRGAEYAEKELTNPTRIVTSTVRVKNGRQQVAPVKTAEDIPKGKIRECMSALKEIELTAPIRIGDIILKNAAGTGVDIVATKDVESIS